MRRLAQLLALAALTALCAAAEPPAAGWLPTGWHLSPPSAAVHTVGLFPQGIALSPDRTHLAVVDSGDGPPALELLDATTLAQQRSVTLPGAFGRPVWLDATHVLIAGANDDAIESVNVASGTVARIMVPHGSWPAQVAVSPSRTILAVSDDFRSSISLGSAGAAALASAIRVGGHPSDLLFSRDGKWLYVALRGESRVAVIRPNPRAPGGGTLVKYIAVGLHPAALALSKDGRLLYVAESDDDALGIVDLRTLRRVADVDLSLHDGRTSGYGASPNAITIGASDVYVSLGQENAVAVVANRHLLGRIPVGWYPSGVAVGSGERLYVSDADGESSPANPEYDPYASGPRTGYVGASLHGSVRLVRADALDTPQVVANASQDWTAPAHTVVRPDGPIKHVIYIIKENRTYDQVLGDVPNADGDPSLAWFAARITPNEHALVQRFGVFDRAFADAQISADGHNWSTAAFANDYVERTWPVETGHRRDVYDFEAVYGAPTPHNGYLWDDAAHAGISYRDYGEYIDLDTPTGQPAVTHMPNLSNGHLDPHYPGWNLEISDHARYLAWKAEFDTYVAGDDLPALEIVRLPNDHTQGTRPGELTPQAYVAQNDYALGELVDAVSHSPYWATTAIFAIEDDAQNGPDHVDDQRTTLYVASPYALPGTHHAVYTTASVLHTIELLLGLPPMSIYDAVAPPLYDAFGFRPLLAPYNAIAPHIDVNARNGRTAYGAAASMRMNWGEADAVDPRVMNDILAHAARAKPGAARSAAPVNR
ncbi:MAG TPA: bifunctional YncE family protein/alkaline phosphatase family protein [Candidatus Tyrphobacter sp.]